MTGQAKWFCNQLCQEKASWRVDLYSRVARRKLLIGPKKEVLESEDSWSRNDYIDILDHNLLDSVENMFGDAMIPFILHDNALVHTSRNVQIWLDEHDVQVIQWPAQSQSNRECLGYVPEQGHESSPFNKIRTDIVLVQSMERYHARLSAQAVQLHLPTSQACYPIT